MRSLLYLLLPMQSAGVASIMNGIWYSPLDTLRQLLLQLLRDDRRVGVDGMRLVGRLARLRTCGMDLRNR